MSTLRERYEALLPYVINDSWHNRGVTENLRRFEHAYFRQHADDSAEYWLNEAEKDAARAREKPPETMHPYHESQLRHMREQSEKAFARRDSVPWTHKGR